MNPWRVYRYASTSRIVFGPGSLEQLPRQIGPQAKPLIVTDKGVVQAGLLEKATKILDKAGLGFAVFDSTLPDPPLEMIEAAASLYQDQGCGALIGLGGGSSIDTAKAVGVRVSNSGTLEEYASGKPLESKLPALIAVPTTAGTGSEATPVTVISDTEKKVKMLLWNAKILPQGAILDPLLLAGLPPRLAAETGADALSHAIEAFVSLNSQPFSDALALEAVRLVARHLRPMVGDPANVEAAGHMLAAACLGGMAFSAAGLGLVHALAHPLGAHYHVSHGKACALYLPLVMEFNSIACLDKMADLAEAMGEDVHGLAPQRAAELAVHAVTSLFDQIGVPATYDELGIDFELRPEMVEEVLSVPTHQTNPRRSDAGQIKALFETPA